LPATVGVLALQGDFREHIEVFRSLGAGTREVRLPRDLGGVDGLVIPGGESTTIVRLCDAYGLRQTICNAVGAGLPLWGTCAGMIVLARALTDPYPKPFGLLDIEVSRNSFGRQVNSFEVDLDIHGIEGGPFRGVFIRAPAVVSVGRGVEVMASLEDGTPVAVRSERVMAAAFHPELCGDSRVHQLFLTTVERCRTTG
jgi:5'-phosphate synthase pdxT subunit